MRIAPTEANEFIDNYYTKYQKRYPTDSGLDLITPEDYIILPKQTVAINLGIQCEPQHNCGFYLYPRSSISNTPLRLANSVGIIDCTYRGPIIAKVDNISDEEYIVKKGTKLFQLCMPDLLAFNMFYTKEVNGLTTTERGSNGFGSTNYEYMMNKPVSIM